jgi:hypothetical protein
MVPAAPVAMSDGATAEVNTSGDPGSTATAEQTAPAAAVVEAERILSSGEHTNETHASYAGEFDSGSDHQSSTGWSAPQPVSGRASSIASTHTTDDVDSSAGDDTSDGASDAIGDDDDAEDDELSAEGDDSHEMVAGPRHLDD